MNRFYRLSAFDPVLEAAIKENGVQAFSLKSIVTDRLTDPPLTQ
jgi:hypothetical protein